MNEDAIKTVLEFTDDRLENPTLYFQSWNHVDYRSIQYSRHNFETRSYAFWAIDEILQLIYDHPKENCEDLILGFYCKMVAYKNSTKNPKAKLAFSIALMVTDDVLRYFDIKEVK